MRAPRPLSVAAVAAMSAALTAGLATSPSSASGPASGPATGAAGAVGAVGVAAERTAADRERAARDSAREVARSAAPLGARDGLVPVDTMLDRDGASDVRFERTYAGLPVVGGDVVVHQSADGELESLSGRTPRLRTATTPTVSGATATRVARGAVGFRPERVRRDLVVLARDGSALAWRVNLMGVRGNGAPVGRYVFVAARGGASVLDSWPSVLSEQGTGEGFHNGTVPLETTRSSQDRFFMVDQSRGAQRVENLGRRLGLARVLFSSTRRILRDGDNQWGDGKRLTPKTMGVDAAYGAAQTWDFYREEFGRLGANDDGAAPRVLVNTGPFPNAFWIELCDCTVLGNGALRIGFKPLTTIDVVAHELTHGVTGSSARLIYDGESGGLNEATSDILGTAVEFRADNGQDTPDYLIGEEAIGPRAARIGLPDGYLRRMDRPAADGVSQNCYNRRTAKIDVHFSSGVGNHFFYLLAEGSGPKTINGVRYDSPTCNRSAIDGIGLEAAQAIWYRALTRYMTPTTDYSDARDATAQAATDLFGPGSDQVAAVEAAWSAVRVS